MILISIHSGNVMLILKILLKILQMLDLRTFKFLNMGENTLKFGSNDILSYDNLVY